MEYGTITVVVTDEQQLPVPGATLELLALNGNVMTRGISDDHGAGSLKLPGRDSYLLRVDLTGFEPFVGPAKPTNSADIHVVLRLGGRQEVVSVTPLAADAPDVRTGVVIPTGVFGREFLQRLPLHVAETVEVLSAVPGVVRSTTGELSIKGATEQQSGLLVNELNATDPATGSFRLSVPVDAVEAVQVFLHPYTAEYGQFTGGVTRVQTRAGGDQWHFEFNDFLPDFRFVGGKLAGVADDAPHLNLSGPLLDHRIFLSQSLAYTIANRPVRGLQYPFNETHTESQNYFSQLDFNLHPRHTQTVTVGLFPERRRYVGLDLFRPQPVTPNARQRDSAVAFHDNSQLSGGLLSSSLSVRTFNTTVWGQGTADQVLTPVGEQGNYFESAIRRSSRVELFELYALPTKHVLTGSHDVKLGFDVNSVSSGLEIAARPVDIVRADGTLAERITFGAVGPIRALNQEYVGFVQDRWSVRPNLTLDFGLRYENQRIADGNVFAPRAGVAWSPRGGSTVIRGGVGKFFDKVPLNIRSFTQYPARTVTRYGEDGTTVLDTTVLVNTLVDAVLSAHPVGDESLPEAAFIPQNLTWNVQLDQKIKTFMTLHVDFIDSQTSDVYIVDPRTDQNGQAIIALGSSGRSAYRALELTTRFSRGKQTLYVSYVRSRAVGDLNDFNTFFGDSGEPVIRPNQYSRLPNDTPNRLLTWGTVALPHRITLSPIFEWRNGFPFSIRDAGQNFVGVRNATDRRLPPFLALDLEAAKDVQLTRRYGLRLSVRGFNVTNHFNPRNVRANTSDPGFGQFLASYRRYFTGGFDIIF